MNTKKNGIIKELKMIDESIYIIPKNSEAPIKFKAKMTAVNIISFLEENIMGILNTPSEEVPATHKTEEDSKKTDL